MPLSGSLEVSAGCNTVVITPTVTVTAQAYVANQSIGGLLTLTGFSRYAAGSGLIQSVQVGDVAKQNAAMDIVFFKQFPSTSTITDTTATNIVAADLSKIIGVMHLTDWTSFSATGLGQSQTQAMPFVLTAGTTAYAAIVSRGTPTYTATTNITIQINVLQD